MYPRKKSRYQMHRQPGGPRSRSGRFREETNQLPLSGFKPWNVQTSSFVATLPTSLYVDTMQSWKNFTLDAGLLARSQYPEGPATGHLDTGFSWFPCVYKRMLRWFPSFQVATTCFSCSPPDLIFLVTFFSYLCTCKITTATG